MRIFLLFYLRDLFNFCRFGFNSPRALALMFVDPRAIQLVQAQRLHKRKDAGRVVAGDWDRCVEPLAAMDKHRVIYQKVKQNLSWEEAGIFEIYKDTQKYPLQENIARHNKLSELIEYLRQGGKFLTRREIQPGNFREDGGVLVHVGREGELIFSGNGYHRLAIAQALELPSIPVALGVVHAEAVRSGKLRELMQHPRA
ncbi:hypothetical protein [Pseudomonas xionganensis]|uniref:Uncharacterized protein n=1 Tax=Pseudomonas xionganensis TaxID=2654845 RepID=A0A6I4KVG1_9PSED|nr:hypothetical protein [Pseudomonas xionganensis]MVW76077.1 hypothetical protein [Pseudomonas xionganensis]